METWQDIRSQCEGVCVSGCGNYEWKNEIKDKQKKLHEKLKEILGNNATAKEKQL